MLPPRGGPGDAQAMLRPAKHPPFHPSTKPSITRYRLCVKARFAPGDRFKTSSLLAVPDRPKTASPAGVEAPSFVVVLTHGRAGKEGENVPYVLGVT